MPLLVPLGAATAAAAPLLLDAAAVAVDVLVLLCWLLGGCGYRVEACGEGKMKGGQVLLQYPSNRCPAKPTQLFSFLSTTSDQTNFDTDFVIFG